MSQYNKPVRPQDLLGDKVELTAKTLSADPWGENLINDLGKAATPPGHDYMGTITIHCYRTNTGFLKTDGTYDIAFVTRLGIKDMNEYISVAALQNASIELRKYYGRSVKTTDARDKRGIEAP